MIQIKLLVCILGYLRVILKILILSNGLPEDTSIKQMDDFAESVLGEVSKIGR